MKQWQGVAVAVLCWAVAASAQAFNVKTQSLNPLLSDDVLRSAALQAAAAVGSNIPDDPNVKVFVQSKARPVKPGEGIASGNYVYVHRVELRRAFNAGVAPYAYAGWLPIEDREFYGIGNPNEVRAKLDETLRDFFTHMNSVDPSKSFQ